jgi:hypothetical protein
MMYESKMSNAPDRSLNKLAQNLTKIIHNSVAVSHRKVIYYYS